MGPSTTGEATPNDQTASAGDGLYAYTILRYVHDIETAEFINVGVVVASSETPGIAARFQTSHRRVKSAFPSLDIEVFVLACGACRLALTALKLADVPSWAVAKVLRSPH